MTSIALVIDDSKMNIELIEAYLKLFDVKAIGATSGQEGFAIAQNLNPAIIFVDLLMPQKTWDGYETIAQLKEHALTKHIPIVAMSAAGDEELAYKAGCDEFMKLPFQTGNISAIVNQLVNDLTF